MRGARLWHAHGNGMGNGLGFVDETVTKPIRYNTFWEKRKREARTAANECFTDSRNAVRKWRRKGVALIIAPVFVKQHWHAAL